MDKVLKHFKKHKILYLMLLPAIIWYIVFRYVPMAGASLAFRNYHFNKGIFASPWVGLDNFRMMFKDSAFKQAFLNTIIISGGKILFGFPIPIISALMLNEILNKNLKKFFQTLFTFPHFLSWVVMSVIFINLFSATGVINQFLLNMSFEQFMPLITASQFRPFLWISYIWKEFGWDSIIYLAAIAGVDQQLYEAARIDGASKLQQVRYVTLPGIAPIITTMLILQVGNLMGSGSFDQVFNLYSAPVFEVGDIIDTYVQRNSFQLGANFGYTTAVGLFKSIINFFMLFGANKIVSKFGQKGIFGQD